MIHSTNHHQPAWLPWFLWAMWNPVDAIGCRNEHTGVTDHAKVTTTGFIAAALVLHALGKSLLWWELLILGTLCFSSLALFSALLKSGIFSGRFSESDSHATENENVNTTTTTVIRVERDPAAGIDPA